MTTLRDLLIDLAQEATKWHIEGKETEVNDTYLDELVDEYVETIKERIVG